MSQPHWRLILNGKSAGNEAVREAVATMRRQGVQLDVRVTWESGDGGRYVAEAIADGVDTVIAGGGDGTLSEVASALRADDDAGRQRLCQRGQLRGPGGAATPRVRGAGA
jgi:diacylglycerol kinase family enzyme